MRKVFLASFLIALGLSTFAFGEPLSPKQDNELRLHFLNTGTGSCQLVECPGDASPMRRPF